eukprot:835250-Pelagomonas_calceolata.AAC.1
MSLILNLITRTPITQKSVPSIPSCCLNLQCVCPKSETANIPHDMWKQIQMHMCLGKRAGAHTLWSKGTAKRD